MTPTVSLCMIVRNEAETLPRCLESVRGWVDEVVVVDTGSSDATPALAAAAGARIVHWAWRDDFAAARNESLRHATGAWILVLDADETLTAEAGPALRHAVGEAQDDVVGFLIKIVCPRDGDGGLVRLNWFPRLFRNLPGVQFEGVIHEQVIGSLAGRGRIERSRVEVHHGGYVVAPERLAAKNARNIRLLERQLRDDPSYAPGWFQLAESHVFAGRHDAAIDAYRRALRLLETSRLTLPPSVVAVALQNLGAALLARGDRDEGVRMLLAALATDPALVPAHVHLGSAALATQRWADAERHFGDALAAVERADEECEYQASPWLVHFLRGCARARQDRLADATASFEAALAVNPRHAESLWLLALATGSAGRWDRSLGALDRLAALGRNDFALHAQRAQTLAAAGRHAELGAAVDRAMEDPTTTPQLLVLLAEALARHGAPREAARAFERAAILAERPAAPLLAAAQCYETLGDGTAMMDAYGRAVAVAPDSPEVLFALGSACLRGGALEAAEPCLASAVDRQPDRLEYRLNLALCLLKRGDMDGATMALDAIALRWPDAPGARELGALVQRLRVAAAPVA